MMRFCCLFLLATGGSVLADDKKPTPADLATRAMDAADKAASVKMTMRADEAGKAKEEGVFLYRRDLGVRVEQRDAKSKELLTTFVFNIKDEKMLTLDAKAKTATVVTKRASRLDAVIPASMRQSVDVTAGGEEQVGGRAARVYEGVTKAGRGGTWTLWVDSKSGLTARIRLDKPGPNGVVVAAKMDFEDWDKELDAKLFSTDVPAGYKLVEPKK